MFFADRRTTYWYGSLAIYAGGYYALSDIVPIILERIAIEYQLLCRFSEIVPFFLVRTEPA